ncbi:MAG: hypothetical protein ACR2NR_05570 [Solirubrobacteraceae bacterium]
MTPENDRPVDQRHAPRISMIHPPQLDQAGIRRKQQRADMLELQPAKLI